MSQADVIAGTIRALDAGIDVLIAERDALRAQLESTRAAFKSDSERHVALIDEHTVLASRLRDAEEALRGVIATPCVCRCNRPARAYFARHATDQSTEAGLSQRAVGDEPAQAPPCVPASVVPPPTDALDGWRCEPKRLKRRENGLCDTQLFRWCCLPLGHNEVCAAENDRAEKAERRAEELAETMAWVVKCTGTPNPSDPAYVRVMPGQAISFSQAIIKARALLAAKEPEPTIEQQIAADEAAGRCVICSWPLAKDGNGCLPGGDCSFRPHSSSPEWVRLLARRNAMAARVAQPEPQAKCGDCGCILPHGFACPGPVKCSKCKGTGRAEVKNG